MYSCLVCLWNEQKSVSRHEQKFGYTINCTPPLQSSKEIRWTKSKLQAAFRKKSLKDALNCDIMPLSQNNTEWNSYLTLTSWIKVFRLIASCCPRQIVSESTWRKLLQVVSNILPFSLFNFQIPKLKNKHHSIMSIASTIFWMNWISEHPYDLQHMVYSLWLELSFSLKLSYGSRWIVKAQVSFALILCCIAQVFVELPLKVCLN